MDTKTFLSTLKSHEARVLIFDLGERRVQPGYHVTEVKAVNVQAMDCGGRKDAWHETLIQLWVPNNLEEQYMNVGKFLDIYGRVAAHVPIEARGELRIEYGDIGAPAISYFVSEINIEGEEVVVRLEPPVVTCKARGEEVVERSSDLNRNDSSSNAIPVLGATSSCCAPTSTDSSEQTSCCG